MEGITGSVKKDVLLYSTQIRHLDEQLARYQFKHDDLEKKNKDLASQLRMMEEDKKDILEYLNYTITEVVKEVNELSKQLESGQQAADQEAQALKLQHSREIQELQKQRDELRSLPMMQAAKVEEEKEQLMQQQSDLESTKKHLISQKKEHDALIGKLKEEEALDWNKIINKRETIRSSAEANASKILHEEREQQHKRLENIKAFLCENAKLWEQIDTLRNEKDRLCCRVQSQEAAVNSDTTENLIHMKELEKLKKRWGSLKEKEKQRSIAQDHMHVKAEEFRQELASVSEEYREQTARVHQLKTELLNESRGRRQLEATMQEAVIILRHLTKENVSNAPRKVRRLLQVLENAIPKGAALNDSPDTSSGGLGLLTSDPESSRADTLSDADSDPLFLLVRHRQGDLGIMPRPTWKIKPNIIARTLMLLNRKYSKLLLPPSGQKHNQETSGPQMADSEAGASTSADF